MLKCPWALVKGHTGWFFSSPTNKRIRSKTKVLCSQDMRERQIWKPATRMVGDKCWHVSRSSTENSLAIWTFKRAWKRWISQTAVTLVWKISKEIFVPQSEEGHSSASLEFIPSVYGGKALPASQAKHTPADTHTHTPTHSCSVQSSHTSGLSVRRTVLVTSLFQLDATSTGF